MIKSILTYSSTVIITLATFTALAQPQTDTRSNNALDAYAETTDNDKDFTLQQAVDAALTQKGGHIIEAELEREDGNYLYEIKGIDANGKSYKVYLNAATGQTVKSDDD